MDGGYEMDRHSAVTIGFDSKLIGGDAIRVEQDKSRAHRI
jgi:hypothetical protein